MITEDKVTEIFCMANGFCKFLMLLFSIIHYSDVAILVALVGISV